MLAFVRALGKDWSVGRTMETLGPEGYRGRRHLKPPPLWRYLGLGDDWVAERADAIDLDLDDVA